MSYILKYILKRIPILVALSFGLIATAHADPNHTFRIVNHSGYRMVIANPQVMCVKSYVSSLVLSDGASGDLPWVDKNNGGSQLCGDQDKYVAYTIQFVGGDGNGGNVNQFPQYIGMIHRNFNGSWYNAFFYGTDIHSSDTDGPTWDGNLDYTFGFAPPFWISPTCPAAVCEIGGMDEVYYKPKDGYNWQYFYKSESGWILTFNKPVQ